MQKPSMKVTIKDVAADAKVSTATVSYVLNNSRNVSGDIAARVQASVKRLNYYPNRVVSGIRRRRTNTIGFLIPSIANETMSRIADRIQGLLFREGLCLSVFCSHHDRATEELAVRTMLMHRFDAILAIPSFLDSPALEEAKHTGIPIILLDRELTSGDFDSIRCNNYKGEYLAVNYLIRMGHNKIGYVDRMVKLSHSIEQYEGYLAALRDNGIKPNEGLVVNAHGHYYHAGIEAAQTLMHHAPDITAIACYYDLIAFGVIRGLLELGYRVPEDVSVIGYDNMVFTKAMWPSLTTVDISINGIAESACDFLAKRLKDRDKVEYDSTKKPTKLVLEPRLILRESVKRLVNESKVSQTFGKK